MEKKVYSVRYVLNYQDVALDRVFPNFMDAMLYAVKVYKKYNGECPFRFFKVSSKFVDLQKDFREILELK